MDVRVYLLAAAVFLAGVAENICVGILPAISAGLRVSVAAAGQLTTIFSAVFALAALVAAAVVARIERRTALLASLGTFAAANLFAAASAGYASLFAARVLMAASCAMLILVATRLAAELAAPAQRGRAIGIVFMGISASLVLGVPIGMRIADWAGWRAVFASIAVPALPLAIWLGRRLPRIAPADAASRAHAPPYRAVLGRPTLVAAQLVSVAMIGGHFTLFAYLTPYLQAVLSPGAAALEALYVAFGIAGVIGAWAGGTLSDRLGARRALVACPALFVIAMAVLPAAAATPLAFVPAMMLWGALSWAISPIAQNHLIHAAPALADASVGINVSAMHAGVALGAAFGGVLVERGALLLAPWAGCALVALALGCACVAAHPTHHARR
ncbi:MFS transporter [Burkholderia multivorans]|uniref:MFS transporter n=1 Tax=Burkholderia multivorans TaxID=87883 RepID=UPI000D006B2E|nr:MFS transporter [Burkholderia multivorans]MBJ9616453.1 MFS transporter [Burkholderia multivorans]MBU9326920.1 MFS transporter [Burkholderia multivorans]MBU9529120.1 MFS transporter [Burkholderia multivorans]MDR8783721.1 Purine efflux pump PbuE [Burkholderia multivorans]MDR8824810.1 Purine efflux pump PbuE [Burkholderia multivorans]